MKKILSLILAVSIFACCFVGCFGKTTLTTENAEEYIQLNINIEKKDKVFFTKIRHKGIKVDGSLNGIYGYSYEDVEATVEYEVEYYKCDNHLKEDTSELCSEIFSDTVTLDIGGNATLSSEFEMDGVVSIQNINYQISSITGSVAPT